MTKAPSPTEMWKEQSDNTNNATKSSITQRLRTDLWWSVGVTTATQLVWLTRFTGPTFPSFKGKSVVRFNTFYPKVVLDELEK